METSDFRIEYTTETYLDTPIDDIFQYFSGKIIFEENDGQEDAGKIDFVRISTLGFENNKDFLWQLDCESLDLYTIGKKLYGPRRGWSKDAGKILGADDFANGLMVINSLKIYPKFRGMKLGLQLIKRTVDIFSNDYLVALQAQPAEGGDSNSNIESLKKYYEKLGFEACGKSNIMCLNPHYNWPEIALEDIGNVKV
jgi:GNAT superfamily N-acetyltransferase